MEIQILYYRGGWEKELKKIWDNVKLRNLDFRGVRARGQFAKKQGVSGGAELWMGGMKIRGIPLRKHTKTEMVDCKTEETLDVQTSFKGMVESINDLMKGRNSLRIEFGGENYIKSDIIQGTTLKTILIKR